MMQYTEHATCNDCLGVSLQNFGFGTKQTSVTDSSVRLYIVGIGVKPLSKKQFCITNPKCGSWAGGA